MNGKLRAFALALTFLVLISAILLTFTLGFSHPLPWVFVVILVVVVALNKKLTESDFVTWKDEYSVGIESIDRDHKKLLNLINNLQNSALYYTGEDFERQALKELVDYTEYHFKREETLMEENGFPDFESHRQEHQKMTEKVKEMVVAYERDDEKTIVELAQFLKNWLISHINGSDQEYSGYLIKKGVK